MKESEIQKEFKKIEKLLATQDPKSALIIVDNLHNLISSDQVWFKGKLYFWENLSYKHLGNYKKSEIAAKKGIAIFRKLGDFIESSKILRDQGLAYEYVEMYDESLDKLSESFEELRSHGVIDAAGVTLSKMGQVYLKKNDLEKSKYFCELGYSLCREGENGFFLLTSILPLSLLYFRLGNYTIGLELVREAEDLLEKLNDSNKFINTRRQGEIALRKSLLLLGVNQEPQSYEAFLLFSKNCLTTDKDERKFFTNSYDVRHLFNSLIQAGYKDKIVKELEEQYNIPVKDIFDELGLIF